MDGLFDHLAGAFGGGPDRVDAYEKGALARARTEDALARARINRDKAIARSRIGEANLLNPGNDDIAAIMLGEMGGDYANSMRGRNIGQEHGFRATIANPDTPMDARQYAAQAVAGRPVNYLDSMGQGRYADVRDPEAGPQLDELGDLMLDSERALAENRRRPRSSSSEPVVRVLDEDGNVVYAPRSQAPGQPAPSTGRDPRDEAIRLILRELVPDLYYSGYGEGGAPEDRAAGVMEGVEGVLQTRPNGQEVVEEEAFEQESELPDGIPAGSVPIGTTRNGETVWETPDGRRLVAD